MGGEISIKDKEPGETGTCVGFNVFMKMGGIHEQHDIEEGSSIPSTETSESRIRASAFREASSFDGVHCVLLVHGDETRRILRSWMENLGIQVCLVPQLEFLASAVDNLCRVNTSPARTSSDSFECRTDYCFRPRDTVTQILPIALNNSNSIQRGVLVVIDAHYGKLVDMCPEMNFAGIKNKIPCKVVCLADANTSSTDLMRFRHRPCLVGARFLALVNSKKILPLITVSNKISLQNQLQNSFARNSEESNEVFDRMIKKLLL